MPYDVAFQAMDGDADGDARIGSTIPYGNTNYTTENPVCQVFLAEKPDNHGIDERFLHCNLSFDTPCGR